MENDTCRILCKNIAWLRKRHGLSIKEMAKGLNISVRSMKRIEQGEMPYTVDASMLCTLADQFQISAHEIVHVPLEE